MIYQYQLKMLYIDYISIQNHCEKNAHEVLTQIRRKTGILLRKTKYIKLNDVAQSTAL